MMGEAMGEVANTSADIYDFFELIILVNTFDMGKQAGELVDFLLFDFVV